MISYDDPTSGPRLKIERAKHHVNDLNEQLDAFLARRPFKLVVRYKPKRSQAILAVKTEEAIPPALSLVIGDAVHNLRSALDLTLYAMAHAKSPSPHKIQFPFPRKKEGLEGAINSGHVKFAGENVAEAVRRLQPYPDGNELLCGLHALDVRDKHWLLILASRVVPIPAEKVTE